MANEKKFHQKGPRIVQLLATTKTNGPNFTVNSYIVGHRPAAEKEDFIPLQNNGNVKRNMMNVFCRVSNPATQCS